MATIGRGLITEASQEELLHEIHASFGLRRQIQRILPVELHQGGWEVLATLHRHGEARVSEVAAICKVDASVASRHIGALVAAGYLSRRPDPADRRSSFVSLSESGERSLESARAAMADRVAAALADWDDAEIVAFTGQLRRLREQLASAF